MNQALSTKIGVLTVSDRAFRGVYEDRGGPEVRNWLTPRIPNCPPFEMRIVSDDRSLIAAAIEEMAAECCLIITTGGTGFGPRDITPEATEDACEVLIPGFGEKMRAKTWDQVPTAILSRATAGRRGTCLVINLPGNPKAISECLDVIWTAIPHAIETAGGPDLEAEDAAPAPHDPPEKSPS